MNIIGIPRTPREPGRGGSRNAAFRWAQADQDAPPGIAGVVSEEENWERIEYFLAPRGAGGGAARKVRLACHPHDPYTPPGYKGVTRVLGTVEGLKRFVTMHESPYHGLNFCQGTVGEMLDDPGQRNLRRDPLVRRARASCSMCISVTFAAASWISWKCSPTRASMDMARSLRDISGGRLPIHGDARPRAAYRRARSCPARRSRSATAISGGCWMPWGQRDKARSLRNRKAGDRRSA